MSGKDFAQIITFIYKNIDQPLDLESIAENVGISLSTLKRLFLEVTGSSAGSFIRKLRMERAFRSLKNKEESVIEIALSHGFEDHSAFSRSFKKYFGYSPSGARGKINIVHELEAVVLEEPEFIELGEFVIQAVTRQGFYFDCAPRAWDDLRALLHEKELDDDFTGTFVGIGHDNPHDGEVADENIRFSAGVALLDKKIGCEEIILPGGRYAKFNYTGKIYDIGTAYHYIYGAWLSQSPVKIDADKKAFILFDNFPEGFEEQRVSIYVPLVLC